MRVFVPKRSGFCPGVKLAEKKLLEARETSKNDLFVMGELIHNHHYRDYLESLHVHTVDEDTVLPKHSTAVIRTHGISKELMRFYQMHYRVLDLTCVIVRRLQKKASQFSKEGYFVLITGKKKHAEIIGVTSFVRYYRVIEKAKDIENFVRDWIKNKIEGSENKKIVLFSQTTGSRELFQYSADVLKTLGENNEVVIRNTICNVTSLREEEALDIQQKVDVSFVVGDKHSSNANKLFRRLSEAGGHSYFIRDLDELKMLHLPLSEYRSAQVVSSSSTPSFIEKEIVHYLESL